jgi:hypothetical protein
MESVSLKKIRAQVEEYDKKLLANDPRFRREVTMIHEDGSFEHYDSAFLMCVDSSWIVCFTEHHGLRINHADDLLLYWESDRRHEPIEELP